MISTIKDYYWAKKLAKHGCKFAAGVSSLGRKTTLEMEGPVRLGYVAISGGAHQIGAYSYIRSGSELQGSCTIGRYCSIGPHVVIGLEKNKHPMHWLTTALFTPVLEARYTSTLKSEITTIGHDCWIGRGVVIMAGVKVGHGAVIAAGSIVTKDVPPYAVWAGTPAKLVKYRFSSEMIEKLLASQWWNYSSGTLASLPLDNPELSLVQLPGADTARYGKIMLSRDGVSVLNND